MIGAFDLREIQEPVEGHLGTLELYLQQLVGQPFLFFRESYGEELTLHLGSPQERASPRLKYRLRGSYVLTVRGSLWMMIAAEKGVLIRSDPTTESNGPGFKELSFSELQETPPVKSGAHVVWAAPFDLGGGIALHLLFSDGTGFLIRPAPQNPESCSEDGNLPEIADWEVYTPIGRYLRVGPGRKWAYLPSTG